VTQNPPTIMKSMIDNSLARAARDHTGCDRWPAGETL
jgi:hypothetical protein